MARPTGESKQREGTSYLVDAYEIVGEKIRAERELAVKNELVEDEVAVVESDESMVVRGPYEVASDDARLTIKDGGVFEVL